jgi:hypothetical protein
MASSIHDQGKASSSTEKQTCWRFGVQMLKADAMLMWRSGPSSFVRCTQDVFL